MNIHFSDLPCLVEGKNNIFLIQSSDIEKNFVEKFIKVVHFCHCGVN